MKKRILAVILLFLTNAFSGHGQVLYGEEFRVNTFTKNWQSYPQIVLLTNGSFVVCWQSEGQDGSDNGIYGQIFSSVGERVGSEFQVNTYTNLNQRYPKIALLPNGGFVICWDSKDQDTSGWGVFGQIFSENGSRVGAEFQANEFTIGDQEYCEVASLVGGNFAVFWRSFGQDGSGWGLYGQLFSPEGNEVNPEFQISTHTAGDQVSPIIAPLIIGGFAICWVDNIMGSDDLPLYCQLFSSIGEKMGDELNLAFCKPHPKVAALSSGGFVVCWEGKEPAATDTDIYAQIFDSNGKKIGQQFRANTTVYEWQSYPAISVLPGNGFVICWKGFQNEVPSTDVYGQIFSESGVKVGQEFIVNTNVEGGQYDIKIEPLMGGGFVVGWSTFEYKGMGKEGLFGQLFDQNGAKVGKEFRFNTYTKDFHWWLQLAALSRRDFIACWESDGQDGPDGGIYAKRLLANPVLHQLVPFALLEPANDASLTTFNPTLLWQQPSDQIICYPWELQYKIFYDDNSEFSSPDTVRVDGDTTVTLQSLLPGTTYFWKVLAKNIAGDSLWSSNTNAFFVRHDATLVENNEAQLPGQFQLQQNYPNPFNPETTIRYELPGSGFVTVKVLDITGRLVKVLVSGWQTMGTQNTIWDGADFDGNLVAAGIYICQIEFTGEDGKKLVLSRKMSLVK